MKKKLKTLEKLILEHKSVAVAFSGGIDSSLLALKTYELLKDKVCAVTFVSFLLSKKELLRAKNIAVQIGIKHFLINAPKSFINVIQNNPYNRCYKCKRYIFNKIKKFADKNGYKNVFDGSNYNDISDYRPGLKALYELDIKSPLKDANITKKEIIKLAERYELPNKNDLPSPCFATRIMQGQKITEEKIKRIQKSEKFISDLGIKGNLRVREDNNQARIETEDITFLLKNDVRTKIVNKLKKLGFRLVTIDLEGYKKGSMNKKTGI